MATLDIELGCLALPEQNADSAPAIVVVHDVWGLSDHYRELAGRFAEEGFAALALDLYRRESPGVLPEISDVGRWMRSLPDPRVLEDVKSAVDTLVTNSWTGADSPAARGGKVGVVGFCMGGMYSLMSACAVEGVSAAVPFYGLLSHDHGPLHDPAGLDPALKPRSPIEMASELTCPLLAFFGDRDTFIPLGDVEMLQERLGRSDVEFELRVVEGVGHAFMNDTRPDAYAPDAAKMAWTQTIEFLHEKL